MNGRAPDSISIGFQWLAPEKTGDLALPSYETPGSSGMDVCAALEAELVLAPGERALISTGFALAIAEGYEIQVRPRSGLAVKQGITLINAPGTIDADYRGEVKIALINLGSEPVTIRRGDRIAQLVAAPVVRCRFDVVSELDKTQRGSGGFGHTGV
jgi:dUTP pyrophosphatase